MRGFNIQGVIMTEIMSTSSLAKYLRLHEMTIRKYAEKGIIPGQKIDQGWRFDKAVIDRWIAGDEVPKKKGRKKS